MESTKGRISTATTDSEVYLKPLLLQRMKEDYIDDWESGVMNSKEFTVAQKYKMLLSQETLLGIRMTGDVL